MLERGEEPPKSMPRLDLHTVRDLLRNAWVSIEAEQDREWARLLDLYDQIPEEKRTDEMKALIAEGMAWGDPRRPQIELPLVGVRHRPQGGKGRPRGMEASTTPSKPLTRLWTELVGANPSRLPS